MRPWLGFSFERSPLGIHSHHVGDRRAATFPQRQNQSSGQRETAIVQPSSLALDYRVTFILRLLCYIQRRRATSASNLHSRGVTKNILERLFRG